MGFARIPLLALGTVLGFGFAFHSMHHRRHERGDWERHIADVCVGAARASKADKTTNSKSDNVKNDDPAPKTETNEP